MQIAAKQYFSNFQQRDREGEYQSIREGKQKQGLRASQVNKPSIDQGPLLDRKTTKKKKKTIPTELEEEGKGGGPPL
jgi:hypothetical protein